MGNDSGSLCIYSCKTLAFTAQYSGIDPCKIRELESGYQRKMYNFVLKVACLILISLQTINIDAYTSKAAGVQ